MNNIEDELDLVASALERVSSEDRETWVRMGIAIKGALGDAGKTVWMEWSESGQNFNARSAESVWRGIRASGGLGMVFAEAKRNGWSGKPSRLSPEEREERARRSAEAAATAEAERQQMYLTVKNRAAEFHSKCLLRSHPYLARKGFPRMKVPTRGDLIILPMRDAVTGEIWNVQKIDSDGGKFYLRDGRAKGLVLRMRFGSGPTVYCEGFATGLSIRAAMQSADIDGQVVVTFSADNLKYVARGESGSRQYVVGDNDPATKAGKHPGLEAAIGTGLPYWIPPTEGDDANDFHDRHGLPALADELVSLFGR